jgi:MFS family permease
LRDREIESNGDNNGAAVDNNVPPSLNPSIPPSLNPSVPLSLPPPSLRPSPALFVILAEGFLSRLSFGMIGFVLPLFAYRKLGLSLVETGALFSLNLIAEQLFKPLMGWVADRIGLKRAFTIAIAIRSVVALLFSFASAPWHVYSIRFLHGFSESLRDPSVSALIAENADKRVMASSFAWYATAKQSAGSLGRALGGVLLGLSMERYSLVFGVAFALSFLPLFVVARYLKEPIHTHGTDEAAETANGAAGGEAAGAILSYAILGFLIACTAQMISNLFPILATEYGHLTTAQTGLIYIGSILVVVVAGPLFGWISDHVNQKLVLTVRGVANTFSSIVFYFYPTFIGLAVGSLADSIGKAAFRPAWGSLMARVSSYDRKRRARTMSYLSLGEGLGETVGPILGGLLWSTRGVGAMLGARVLLAVIGEIYALRVGRSLSK